MNQFDSQKLIKKVKLVLNCFHKSFSLVYEPPPRSIQFIAHVRPAAEAVGLMGQQRDSYFIFSQIKKTTAYST